MKNQEELPEVGGYTCDGGTFYRCPACGREHRVNGARSRVIVPECSRTAGPQILLRVDRVVEYETGL